MKLLMLFAFLFISFHPNVNAWFVKYKTPQSQNTSADTLFLERHKDKKSYQAIYIDYNKKSVYYKYLSDFRIYKLDRYSYGQSLQQIKKRHLQGHKLYGKRPFNTSGKYLPLYAYHNKLYLYSPCDYMNVGRFMITDSIFVTWFEEPYPEQIKGFNKENETSVVFTTYDYLKSPETAVTNMQLVNSDKRIILFTSQHPNYTRSLLCVPVEYAKNFAIIVNKCEGSKAEEFAFEKPTQARLIELAKNYK